MVDEQTQQNFATCLSSLRLLAKVLGLLVSLPYRSESTTKEIITTQVEIRSKVLKIVIKSQIDQQIFNSDFQLYYSGFTIVKFTSMSSECHNRGKALIDNTLDSEISSHDGHSVTSITILQAGFRTIILCLLCY